MTAFRYRPLILLSLLAILLPLVSVKGQDNSADTPSASRWDYSGSAIRRDVDSRTLQLSLALAPRTEVRSQEIVCVYPSYVSADGHQRVELEPVFVAGNTRWKVVNRRKAMHNLHPGEPGDGELHHIKEIKGDGTLIVRRSTPYQDWMSNGHIEIREESYGCAECGLTTAEECPSVTPSFFGPQHYAYIYQKPMAAAKKRYSDVIECYIRFELDKDILKPHFENNEERLKELDAFVSRNKDILGTELKAVKVQGYACPFATWQHNVDLTSRRAKTFANYIKDTYPELAKAEIFEVKGEAEDWNGLRQAIEKSDEPHKEELISIIDKYSTDTERERAFTRIDNGQTARRIQQRFYPPLRRSVVTLTFDARAYTDGELSRVYESKPEALSAEELSRLGDQMRKEGKNPIQVYRTLYNTHPDLKEARINYASALLEYEKDTQKALEVLAPIRQDPDAMFLCAVAHDLRGEWTQAEALLSQSAAAGSPQAKAYQDSVSARK